MKLNVTSCFLLVVSSFALLAAGCGSSDPGAKMLGDAIDNNAQRLSTMYSRFWKQNKFAGPKDKAELVKFINEQDPGRLKMFGIDPNDREAMFTSDRDGEPFKIRWGINTRVRGAPKPVVFEATGKEGTFLVGFAGGEVKEVDKAEYDKLWAGEMDEQASETRPDAR